MTNHWRDIRHADLIMINGANPAEAHPVGFQWMMRAKLDRGAKMIHVDPRFTRTSAVADQHLRIRTGTDVAYFGGLINYVLQNNLFHNEYVSTRRTRASWSRRAYAFDDGLFNAYDATEAVPTTPAQWTYEIGAPTASPWSDIDHPRSVLNLMRQHYSRLHAGDGGAHHRHPARPVPRGRQARRRDGQAGQGDDDRVRGRPDPPHHRRAAHPVRRAAATAAGQHRTPGRRHERRARPRQHPGQHRPRDLVGHPARIPAGAGARARRPSTTTWPRARASSCGPTR